MDKYEYRVRAEQIKTLVEKREFEEAMQIADTIDWRRVKSISMLCTVSEIYKVNRKYEESRDILLLAYERYPNGRTIVYALCELSIKMEEFVQAVGYYKEFLQIAPKDSSRYILQYRLYEAQDVSLEERIAVLEELKKKDYREKWAYELAYLYHRIGLATRCIEECDEMILWFGDGPYVQKALELKMLHSPLNESQQEKYNSQNEVSEEDEFFNETESEETASEEKGKVIPIEIKHVDVSQEPTREMPNKEIEDEIKVKTVNIDKYSTMNLQEELSKSMQDLFENPEESAGLKLRPAEEENAEEETTKEETAYLPSQEVQESKRQTVFRPSDSSSREFDSMLAQEYDGQISIALPEPEMVEKQITGQMDISEVLLEWEKRKEENDKRRIAEAKRRSLEQTNDIMSQLVGVIPGVQPVPLPDIDATEITIPKESASEETSFKNQIPGIKEELENEILYDIEKETSNKYDMEDESEDELEELEEIQESEEDQEEDYEEDTVDSDNFDDSEDMESEEELEEFEVGEEDSDESDSESLEAYGDESEDYEEEIEDNDEIDEESEEQEMDEDESEEEAEFEADEEIDDEDDASEDEEIDDDSDEEDAEEEVDDDSDEEDADEEVDDDSDEEDEDEEVDDDSDEEDEDEEVDDDSNEEEAEEEIDEDSESDDSEANKKASTRKVTSKKSKSKTKRNEYGIPEDTYHRLFDDFLKMTDLKKMIPFALENMKMQAVTGNIMLSGNEPRVRVKLGLSFAKAMQEKDVDFEGKVAKISAEAFNKKDVAKSLQALQGGALLIERARDLNIETIDALAKQIVAPERKMLIILEDERVEIKKLLKKRDYLNKIFNIKIHVPTYSNDDLVNHAKDYAKEREYIIDEMGILALYTRIDELQTSDHFVTISEVEEIMDSAIHHVDKKNLNHLMDVLFAKRYDEDDLIIIREKDFVK